MYGKAEKLFDVSAGNFNPKPKVDSSVVKISIYDPPRYTSEQIKKTSKVIKAAFSMRRKTLVNALLGVSSGQYSSKETLSELIEKKFGNKNIRGEELSVEQFALLADIILQ